ncbi:DUF2795 domain-containing protein [Saccharomonospora piscinae]|uniref:DUF2795 domain-containing protein n=1 Tax=Saccharomonospora piscinae TaxID=687388 RepID=A0A1V8ZYA5_SACPI|nr:DUF2795 domain-containing protein [Saccharomonospora piscinae]OQO89743.1 hypothetical protein B1813_20910 [Saccharomonospora piscinae]TLW91098.1 DUF2795 domain-containing protein [Saccharomonospora piscinae]
MATTVERLHSALSGADFPAQRDDLVRSAENANADADTIKELRGIPPESYGSLADVERAVSFASPESDHERAKRRGRHTKPGLAEQEKDVPEHPIVEELGENRGS